MCTSWGQVTWLFLLGNTCSNHCDVTVRYVTLNSNCTLNKNRQKISIIILGRQIKINQNALIRWYFENTNYLQWLNCLILNTPVFNFQIINQLINSAIPLKITFWNIDKKAISHDPIWAIWLAEVRKFHQHHDRMFYSVVVTSFIWLMWFNQRPQGWFLALIHVCPTDSYITLKGIGQTIHHLTQRKHECMDFP